MITTLTFTDDPEDTDRLIRALYADKAFSVLWSIREELRTIEKHSRPFVIDDFRDWVQDMLLGSGIDLDVMYS